MLQKFTYSNKLKVSPNSDYYAIVSQDEGTEQTPTLLIVDKEKDSFQIVIKKRISMGERDRENFARDKTSAVIVPDFKDITLELCQTILDTPCNKVSVVRLPLVAEERGSIRTFGGIVRNYS